MPHLAKIVLNSVHGYRMSLDGMVEEFLRDGVKLVAVAGKDCDTVEDIIDELVVGNGEDESRFLMTTSHPGAPLEEAIEFAQSYAEDEWGREVQVLTIE